MRQRTNRLTLKWGTLKSWSFKGDDEAQALIQRYIDIGSSASAMTQRDTPEQKDILCKLIDRVYGKIYLDWDGKMVSHKEAKKYVLEYGKS